MDDATSHSGCTKLARIAGYEFASYRQMSKLLPDRYAHRDFFLADIVGVSLKDDIHSMEHPLFSLSKNKDTAVRLYEHNGNTIEIKPGSDGMPTIWDKDILIYVCSQMVAGINQKRPDARERVIHFRAWDYFVATNREASGAQYQRLQAGLDKLAGVRIKTNIVTGALVDTRVVVIESDEDARATLEKQCNEWGMRVECFTDPVAAREVIERAAGTEEPVDLLISEYSPATLELAKSLRQRKGKHTTKTLFILRPGQRAEGRDLPELVSRPIRPSEFRKRLIQVLDLPNSPHGVIKENFGIIDRWKIIEKSPDDSRMVAIEIQLSQWLYKAIQSKEVLTIDRDYFRLSGGLDRRLYELARKHVGHQAEWTVSEETLYKKTGSSGNIRDFRRMLKDVHSRNELPQYLVAYDPERKIVTFTNRTKVADLAKQLMKVPA